MARAPRLLNADLLADLYGAAADDAQWSRMAAIVAGLTGEPGAGLWVVENGVVTDLFLTSPASDAQIPYVAYYHQQDVWQQAILRLPRETVALGYEHTPERYLLRTEFYNDFLRRYGMFRPMGAIIDVAPGTTATVSLERPGASRLFEEDDKAVLEPVIPHLKRALQLRRQLQEQVRHSRALTPALDAVAFGLIVCDARGRVVFANIAAETLAKAGGGIVVGVSRSLGALRPEEDAKLAALVSDAGRGGPGGVLRLTGKDGAVSLLALVSPLPDPLRIEGKGHVLVALRATADSPAFSVAVLRNLFGLSPTQAEVALALFDGRTPEEIALQRGVSISTLRTHLAEIFLRTGVDSQRGLIRLLAKLPPIRHRE